MKNYFILLLAVITVIGFTSCSDDPVDPPVDPTNTIVDVALGDAQFSTLVAALQRVDLVETLQGDGPFTVFAPTNAAFSALGVDLATISDAELTNILLYHVIGADIKSTDLAVGQTYASTVADGPANTKLSILVERSGTNVQVNGAANVTTADVDADNGTIHIIDQVITPMNIVGHAAANSNFTTLVGALQSALGDLVNVLSGDGPFTVFAPTNDAFSAISDVVASLTDDQLAAVLTYHVVGGANVKSGDIMDDMMVTTVNGDMFTIDLSNGVEIVDQAGNRSKVILTDVQTTNGIIHVIDSVIIPNLDGNETNTIVDIALGNEAFTTLVSALQRVNLVETLQGDGPFTVFAPTNDAFTALGVDLETISDEALTEILLYHVIPASILSTDLPDGQTYASSASASGPNNNALSLLVEKDASSVIINNIASVSAADVMADNGVIHIVDQVIMPLDVVGHASANGQLSSL